MAEVRESKGWLQRDIASHMGVKANTISNWEKGISRTNPDQLCQLCQILSVISILHVSFLRFRVSFF